MAEPLDTLLVELEEFGKRNDASTSERPRRMLNITRDTGELLAVLVQATLARRVLEIGTSNGYSTLWLARAARAIGGSVTTVELSDHKVGLARATFARSGLAGFISLVQADAGQVFAARPTARSISSFSTPSGRSTRDGGPISHACSGREGSWWSTTRRRTEPRWRRSSRW